MVSLVLLLSFISPQEIPYEVDLLELNYYWNIEVQYKQQQTVVTCQLRLVQWVGWVYDDCWHVAWWRWYRGEKFFKTKPYLIRIDGHLVKAHRFEETHTLYDVEVHDRDFFPVEWRINLGSPLVGEQGILEGKTRQPLLPLGE
jgi:hypothetical protein